MLKMLGVFISVLASVGILFGGILIWGMGKYGPYEYTVPPVPGEQTVELEVSEGHARLRLEARGSGEPAVLLLHGFNGSLNNWDRVWPGLVDCGQHIRVDLPGFGESVGPWRDYTVPAQSERMIALLDELAVGRAIVVGTSMGGSIAAWMSAAYPDRVVGAVLMAPSGMRGGLKMSSVAEMFFHRGGLNSIAAALARSPIYKKLYPDSRVLQALTVTASYGERWEAMVSKIRQPVTILWSESDATVPFENMEKLGKAISGARTIAASPEAGHNIPGNDPDLVVQEICGLYEQTRESVR
ncbi:alpha/beta hydrolase [Marinobacter pelagius]|uniref:alpha/beta fold hydrolase n=1 Tax=Marinobacter sp. C7 TaxID=2951363 RepID=UPI001EEF9ED3|nr:alpha/beta hydrolase [Marinobacter sp. C7]MCG7199483.1 alpha/beta hydrolase [Marinobacter sp. C7]